MGHGDSRGTAWGRGLCTPPPSTRHSTGARARSGRWTTTPRIPRGTRPLPFLRLRAPAAVAHWPPPPPPFRALARALRCRSAVGGSAPLPGAGERLPRGKATPTSPEPAPGPHRRWPGSRPASRQASSPGVRTQRHPPPTLTQLSNQGLHRARLTAAAASQRRPLANREATWRPGAEPPAHPPRETRAGRGRSGRKGGSRGGRSAYQRGEARGRPGSRQIRAGAPGAGPGRRGRDRPGRVVVGGFDRRSVRRRS